MDYELYINDLIAWREQGDTSAKAFSAFSLSQSSFKSLKFPYVQLKTSECADYVSQKASWKYAFISDNLPEIAEVLMKKSS